MKNILAFLSFSILISSLLALIGYFFYPLWPFELFLHFLHYGAFACALNFFLLIVFKRPVWAILNLLVALGAGYIALPHLMPNLSNPLKQESEAIFRLASFNIYKDNPSLQEFTETLPDSPYDVVGLIEVMSEHHPLLEKLKKSFPYQITSNENFYGGMAILSRYPIQLDLEQTIAKEHRQVLKSTLTWKDQEITFYLVHVLPPLTNEMMMWQAHGIEWLNNDINALLSKSPKRPLIVAGDFNLSTWSPLIAQLKEKSNLTDIRQFFRPFLTWQSPLEILRLPIDTMFFNQKTTQVQSCEVGNTFHSDHNLIHCSFNFH